MRKEEGCSAKMENEEVFGQGYIASGSGWGNLILRDYDETLILIVSGSILSPQRKW